MVVGAAATSVRDYGICLGVSAIEKDSNDPLPLDYATRATGPKFSGLSAVAAVFGTVAGLFGVYMLFWGIPGIAWLVTDWRSADGQDVFAIALFIMIGALSGYFAFRWIRSAIRGPSRTGGR